MKGSIFTLIVLLSMVCMHGFAQGNNYDNDYDDAPQRAFGHWDLGLNFGMHWAAKYHAGFYDGSPKNVNNVNYVFNNPYWRKDIMRDLNVADTFYLGELPENMRYTGAFQIGMYFRKTFDNYTGLSLQFDYTKLTASDVFTLIIDPQSAIGQEPDIRIYNIWGIEDRINIDILFSKYFKIKSPTLLPFFESGFNINSTRVKENKISIEGVDYSLVDVYLNGSYTPNSPQNTYYVQQGGIGWGVSAAVGLKMIFSDYVSIDPGFRVYYQTINLERYQNFGLSYSIFVRLSLSDFFGGSSESNYNNVDEEY